MASHTEDPKATDTLSEAIEPLLDRIVSTWPPRDWFTGFRLSDELTPYQKYFAPPGPDFSVDEARRWVDSLIELFRAAKHGDLVIDVEADENAIKENRKNGRPLPRSVRAIGDEAIEAGERNARLLIEDVKRRFQNLPSPMRPLVHDSDNATIDDAIVELECIRTWLERAQNRAVLRATDSSAGTTPNTTARRLSHAIELRDRLKILDFGAKTVMLDNKTFTITHPLAFTFVRRMIEADGGLVDTPEIKKLLNMVTDDRLDKFLKENLVDELRDIFPGVPGRGGYHTLLPPELP